MNALIQKWKNMPDGMKSSIAFAASSFIINGISFITTPVFTRILDADQYGLIATYNSWVAILSVFALVGLTSAGVFNVGLNEHKEDRNEFISTVLILCNVITLLLFASLFLLKIPFGEGFIQPSNLMFCMMIYFIFSPAQIFWITRQRYEFKYRVPFVVTVCAAILSQLFSICMILVFQKSTIPLHEIKIWSTTIANLLIQIPIYFHLLKKGKTFINPHVWKSILVFAIPLLPHYLSQNVMNSSDRIMIANYHSAAGVAIYSVVTNISAVSGIIWNAINASIVPFTFEKIEKHKVKEINAVIIPVLLFYAGMCSFVTLIAPEILAILAPSKYALGIYAVPPVTATAFTGALYNLFANVEFYYKKSWWITASTFVASSVNILLNFLLIPRFGYIAAAYTTLISHIVLVLMHYMGYKKSREEQIYNDRLVFYISLGAIIACISFSFLLKLFIIRYAVCLIIGFILIKNREILIQRFLQRKQNETE